MLIGTTLIPEPLNINDDDSPMNSQPLILHRLHPAMTRHKPASINPRLTANDDTTHSGGGSDGDIGRRRAYPPPQLNADERTTLEGW